jgi:hypothetical protein
MTRPIDELLTVGQARELLGVGKRKMAELLKAGREGQPGGLPSQPDPLDKRIKLVWRSDVEALRALSKKAA